MYFKYSQRLQCELNHSLCSVNHSLTVSVFHCDMLITFPLGVEVHILGHYKLSLSSPYRYLIPCNHMMLSQRRVLRERDCYSVSAAKFLALTPSCCSPDIIPPPLRKLDSILWSKVTDGFHTGTIGIM